LRTRQAQTNFRLQLRNDNLLAWRFEIYNIENWVFDEGKELLRQEKGCGKGGGLTFWEWHPATDTDPALAYFDLSFFIAEGCRESDSVRGRTKDQMRAFGKYIHQGHPASRPAAV
jgi:hypothetical protein